MEKSKKIYVNGGIVVETSFFCHGNVGCLYTTPPEGSEKMECDDEVKGQPCIVVTEEKAPSIFNEYYAKTFFSTRYCWADFLRNDFEQDYKDYQSRIEDIKEMLELLEFASERQKKILLRLAYGNVLTAFDSYVGDTILSKITHSKKSFEAYGKECVKNKDLHARLQKMWNENAMDSAEQEVIDKVLTTSYCNMKNVNKAYGAVFEITIGDEGDKMAGYFQKRHLIFHRNGKRKDGTYVPESEEEIKDLIDDTNAFVKQINDKISAALW